MGLNKLFLFFLATRFDIFFRTDYFDIIGKMDEVYQKLAEHIKSMVPACTVGELEGL